MAEEQTQQHNAHHLLVMKVIRHLYLLLGGIYFTNELPKRLQIIARFTAIMGMIILGGAGTIGYFLTAEKLSFSDIPIVFWGPASVTFILIVNPLITYVNRADLLILINYLDKYEGESHNDSSSANIQKIYPFLKRRDSLQETFSCLIIFNYCFLVPITLLDVVDVLFFCKKVDSFRDLNHHNFGVPYVSHIISIYTALLVYFIECILMHLLFSLCCSVVYFTTMSAVELNNIAANLCSDIQNLVDFDTPDAGNSDDEQQNLNIATDNLLRKDFPSFNRKIIAIIRKYQTFTKILRIWQSYFETLILLLLPSYVLGLFCQVYNIMTIELEGMIKLKYLIIITLYLYLFYFQCNNGELSNAMNEALFVHLCDVPWYCLPPKQRKLYHVLLTQFQRQMLIRPFKSSTYALNMQLFPKLLKAVYTYANFLYVKIHC